MYALAHRQVRGATWYAALLLTLAIWSLAYAWELSAGAVAGKPLHRDDLRGGPAVDWHGRVVAKNGRRLLLTGRSTQISDDLIVSTFRDITEQRAQSRQRERLLTEAQAAIRVKDDFLATLSHELRTPIGAVLGWTRMLARREVEPARVSHALGVIERNALAQARLVDDLLDMFRMAAGRLRVSLADTDLTEVVAWKALCPTLELPLPTRWPGPLRHRRQPVRFRIRAIEANYLLPRMSNLFLRNYLELPNGTSRTNSAGR